MLALDPALGRSESIASLTTTTTVVTSLAAGGSAQRFVNDSARNLIDPAAKKVRLSKIFKWYAKDFKLDFSSEERDPRFSEEEYAVLSFIANYLNEEAKVQYLEEASYKIKYYDFDWSLNEWRSNTAKS